MANTGLGPRLDVHGRVCLVALCCMVHLVVLSHVLSFPSSFVGTGVLPYGMGLGPCVQDGEVAMACLVNVGFAADVSGQVVVIRA